jgi:hypothetical protein
LHTRANTTVSNSCDDTALTIHCYIVEVEQVAVASRTTQGTARTNRPSLDRVVSSSVRGGPGLSAVISVRDVERPNGICARIGRAQEGKGRSIRITGNHAWESSIPDSANAEVLTDDLIVRPSQAAVTRNGYAGPAVAGAVPEVDYVVAASISGSANSNEWIPTPGCAAQYWPYGPGNAVVFGDHDSLSAAAALIRNIDCPVWRNLNTSVQTAALQCRVDWHGGPEGSPSICT